MSFEPNLLERKLVRPPLYSLEIGENPTRFMAFDSYNPDVKPGAPRVELPDYLKSYVEHREKAAKVSTYEQTIRGVDWEKQLFFFICSYLMGYESSHLKEACGITNIRNLTPKQAAELATRVVINLTKYNYAYIPKDHLDASKPTQADQSTTLELLTSAKANLNNPNWPGNGVCRNTAGMVKAVFEALKAFQDPQQTRLNNTICLYESGYGYRNERRSEFDGAHPHYDHSFSNLAGHAWNAFITINEKEAVEMVSIDATWGKYNLDTGQPSNLDHTERRSEHTVYQMIEAIPGDDLTLRTKAYLGIAELYRQYIVKKSQAKINYQETRNYYIWRLLNITADTKQFKNFPDSLIPVLKESYQSFSQQGGVITPVERLRLLQLAYFHPNLNIEEVLDWDRSKKFIKDALFSPPVYYVEGSDQKIYEVLFQLPVFQEMLIEDLSFRTQMRLQYPEFFRKFSPQRELVDFQEFIYYIEHSTFLKPHIRQYARLMNDSSGRSLTRLSPEATTTIIESAKQLLRDKGQPDRVEKILSTKLDQLELLSNFDQIYRYVTGQYDQYFPKEKYF